MKRFAIAAAMGAIFALPALAHSPLESTSPANDAILASAPEQLKLVFSKPARITKLTMTNEHSEGAPERRLKVPVKKFTQEFVMTPEFKGAGIYRIDWRALSEDGHPLKGSFKFTVQDQQ